VTGVTFLLAVLLVALTLAAARAVTPESTVRYSHERDG
jgi:hypothetical protein